MAPPKNYRWSEWEFSEEYQRQYRYRIDANDPTNYQYQWDYDTSTPREQADASVGKLTDQLEGLTYGDPAPESYSRYSHKSTKNLAAFETGRGQGLGAVEEGTPEAGRPEEGIPEEATFNEEPPSEDAPAGFLTRDAAYGHFPPTDNYQSRSRRKGKSRAQDPPEPIPSETEQRPEWQDFGDDKYGQPVVAGSVDRTSNNPGPFARRPHFRPEPRSDSATDTAEPVPSGGEDIQGSFQPRETPRSQAGFEPEDEHEVVDEAMQAAIEASRQTYAPRSRSARAGGAYGRGYPSYPDPSTSAAPTSQEDGVDEVIYGKNDGNAREKLDKRYRVEHSSKFEPGSIFKVLWSEPQGTGQAASTTERQRVDDGYGGHVYVGFRRFIVIGADQGHSTCVPILTYGGKGCKKRGVKPDKHGIIYEKNKHAHPLDKEPKLGFRPVRVKISAEGETIQPQSRANYSKLVTVEHNVKVFFIGRVVKEDFKSVQEAVNQCWQEKDLGPESGTYGGEMY